MSLTDSIPNNVDLGSDKKLLRALEKWQPNFRKWWMEMGPDGFQQDDIWLRTAVSVESDGWAHYDYVRMPDYRWGIFLTPNAGDRTIGFGDNAGGPSWNEVPGELRGILRRIIVTQADTEPASVEQQRQLGKTAPSLYDLRNLFQVNVEEGRHLWAMVHLLHQYFGRDGREEAEALLERRSGDADKPRILQTFNESTDDWMSFFMFTMFTDRDGKYQLAALSESGFDPLARATQFMLTEEAFHLFTGETGVDRIVRRAAEAAMADRNEDARAQGAIDLATVQKWINFWFSSAVELFGGEISSNAADYFATGLKGRYREQKKYDDHSALGGVYGVDVWENGRISSREVPLRNAMNEVLRDEYIADCERASQVEPHHPGRRVHGTRAHDPSPALQSHHGHLFRWPLRPEREPHQRGRVRKAARRVAADRRRSRICHFVHEAGLREGEVRAVDRTPDEGRPWAAGRPRVREVQQELSA
jgi:benzoyl-CoA 2,3-dioxygenase component B